MVVCVRLIGRFLPSLCVDLCLFWRRGGVVVEVGGQGKAYSKELGYEWRRREIQCYMCNKYTAPTTWEISPKYSVELEPSKKRDLQLATSVLTMPPNAEAVRKANERWFELLSSFSCDKKTNRQAKKMWIFFKEVLVRVIFWILVTMIYSFYSRGKQTTNAMVHQSIPFIITILLRWDARAHLLLGCPLQYPGCHGAVHPPRVGHDFVITEKRVFSEEKTNVNVA